MRVQVIYEEGGLKAESKVVETLFTVDAMTAHGDAILKKELYDRNILSVESTMNVLIMKPTYTVKAIENEVNKQHFGIVTGYSLNITADTVDMSYTAEVICE